MLNSNRTFSKTPHSPNEVERMLSSIDSPPTNCSNEAGPLVEQYVSEIDDSTKGEEVQECDHINNPSVLVQEVLREVDDIVHDRGAPRIKPESGSEVLLDEVDFQFSPLRNAHPLEIIVRHNTVLSQLTSETHKPVHNRLPACFRMDKPLAQQNFHGTQNRFAKLPPTVQNVNNFKKGHRRAYSTPISSGIAPFFTIIDNDEKLMADGLHKRHIVKYRLHPQRAVEFERKIPLENGFFFETVLPTLIPPDDDDNELEIEINEEEIIDHNYLEAKSQRTIIKKFWEARWKVTNFEFLPDWLQDNEYLRTGHRPPLSNFGSCFKSIFSLHTETGNIWTHMYGCMAFIGLALWFLTRSSSIIQWQEKVIFSTFFVGAVACLGMSFAFHTVQCHSPGVGRLFSKLDYTGISLLIVGSFLPWIYYGFYCRILMMIIYMSIISILGIAAVIVSLWDRFADPQFRPVRAGVFVAMGLSSVVPVFHNLFTDGANFLLNELSFHWLVLMGLLYLTGAAIYATRTPERFFPGKFDLWFQSHQIFHMFVIAAAFVHFHGITDLAVKRLEKGSCAEQLLERYGLEEEATLSGFLPG